VANGRVRNGSTPTVLLVHDAFADSGTWAGTIRAGSALGTELIAVPNPLRGLDSDARQVAEIAVAVDGPVVLVGHGYGSAVVSAAAPRADNVVGLVHIAGWLPSPSASLVDLLSESPRFLAALVPYSAAGGVELYIDRAAYPSVIAADLSAEAGAVAAALQRPVLAAAFEERPTRAPEPGIASHYLVATADCVLDPARQLAAAASAGSTVVRVDASHAVVLSRPDAVADVIRSALACR